MESLIFLDTHVAIWLYSGRLDLFRPKVLRLINDNQVCISHLVRLEMKYLNEIGRINQHPDMIIDALIDELQIRPYFSAVVSAFSLPSKPDPAVFLEAARQIGVPPNHCIVIEDAIPGVEAAHRAGMKCIAVTITNPREDLSIADIIVDSLEELKTEHFTQVPG